MLAFEQEFIEDISDGDEADEPELDEESKAWVHDIVIKIMVFMERFTDVKLYPYQKEPAYRIIESVITNDGESITMLQARQSGKSEVLANVIATLMVILPRLAKAFPKVLGQFLKGFWVGVFAPTDDQADTVWSRVVDRLTSEHAQQFLLLDPELQDSVRKSGAKAKAIILRKSGSLCRMQTCNPKAKIESKTYHFALIDEAQDADDKMVEKSINPMLSTTNGTIVKTGTPTTFKGDFFRDIQFNKRRQTKRRAKQNHFEYDYKFVCKYNAHYRKHITKQIAKYGLDSDFFQMSYCCKWFLEQGMFTTEDALKEMGDPRMNAVPGWWKHQVVVGVDPARTKDSTVVTVLWVDWDHPDEYGIPEHRILAWLEIHNKEWERQYAEIYNFLSNYSMLRIGVDVTGMGGPVAERLQVLFPDVDVIHCQSEASWQAKRWKHLKTIMERKKLVYPAGPRTRKTRSYKRFVQQMTDLEVKFTGPNMLAAAPDAADANDDYADSLALACYMTIDDVVEDVVVIESPFYNDRRRRR